MTDYDKLKEQAEEMAKGKKTAELAKLGFIYSYIANHQSTALAQSIDSLKELFTERLDAQGKLIWGLLITIILSIGLTVVAGILRWISG